MNKPPLPCRHEPAPPRCLVAAATPIRLARFKWLMSTDGWAVDLGRMCIDRIYAADLLAVAHSSDNDLLRAMAVQLFEDYRRGPTIDVILG